MATATAAWLRRPVADGRSIATLFLHPACDLACPFCAADADFDRLDQRAAEEVVTGIARAGFRCVVFGGGEPVTWAGDLAALAGHARQLGLATQVSTNGWSLPEGWTGWPVDRWILPLESAEPEVHDRLRPAPGGDASHFGRVRERLDELRSAGGEITVSTVVSAANVDGVADLADRLAAWRQTGLRLHAWHLYRFLPVGRGGRRTAAELGIERERYLGACRRARARAETVDLGVPVYRRDDMRRPTTVEYVWRSGGELVLGSDAFAPAAGI